MIRRTLFLVLTLALILMPTSVQAQNALPQGLDYPFNSSNQWVIINGYNDGSRHGGSPNYDDWRFYAYYGFDFIRSDGTTGGQAVIAPANIYYYRVQNTDEKCMDASIGSFGDNTDLYIEFCHVNFTQSILQGGNNVQYTFIPKGTQIGTVAPLGGCPSCNPSHIHIAAFFGPVGSPWDNTGLCYDNVLAFCRLPIAFQNYANFSLALGGDNYPPKESQLFQVMNQYDNSTIPGGGGSTEGYTDPGSGSTGNDTINFWESTDYGGSQYGNSDSSSGVINIPGGQENTASSIQVSSGNSVMIYQDLNGQGGKRCLNQSVPNLSYTTFDNGQNANDAISSFDWFMNSDCNGQLPAGVASGDSVTVFAGFSYEGTQYGGHGTAMFNLPDYIEGAVSSIGVYLGKSALVFEFDNQQGGVMCFSASDTDLRDNVYNNGHVVNDNMHSLQLFEDGNCAGWSPNATMWVDPTTVNAGAMVNGFWTGLLPTGNDWMSMHPAGAPDSTYLTWQYVSGASGSKSFSVPNVAGSYEFRLFRNGQKVGTSNTFTIIAPTPTITPTPTATPEQPVVSVSFVYEDDPSLINERRVKFDVSWSGSTTNYYEIDHGDGWEVTIDERGSSGQDYLYHIYTVGTFYPVFIFYGQGGVPYQYQPSEPVVVEPSTATSIPSGCPGVTTSGISLFADAYCAGGNVNFTIPGTYNLADSSFAYAASSDHIQSGWSVLLQNDNGQQVCHMWDAWNYTQDTWPNGAGLNDSVVIVTVFNNGDCTPSSGSTDTPSVTLTPSNTPEQTGCPGVTGGPVVLFADAYCAGGYLQLDTVGTYNLASFGFAYQTSSAHIQSGWSLLVQNNASESVCHNWDPWNYSQDVWSSSGTTMNDSIVSVTVYEGGDCVGQTPTNTDVPSGCPGVGTNAILLFKDAYCAGESLVLDLNGTHDVNAAGFGYSVSSIHAPDGWAVRVFNDSGQSRCYLWDAWDLSQDSFDGGGSVNDTIVSVVVNGQDCN